MKPGRIPGSAHVARQRLLGDKAVRPVADGRARLHALGERLDTAARRAMTDHLATRVRANRDFAPVLGTLMRMALNG